MFARKCIASTTMVVLDSSSFIGEPSPVFLPVYVLSVFVPICSERDVHGLSNSLSN